MSAWAKGQLFIVGMVAFIASLVFIGEATKRDTNAAFTRDWWAAYVDYIEYGQAIGYPDVGEVP